MSGTNVKRGHFYLLVGWLLAGLLMLIGFNVRLSNVTNLPFDFHPTRQLRSAIIARGMYYEANPQADPQQRKRAVALWKTMEAYEPPVLEKLVALTYTLVGGERLWVPRVYSSLFWLLGGAALFALCRRLFSTSAALFSLAFYLLLPWGVVASRSFQPDPLMVMSVLVAMLAMDHWAERKARSWGWALLAGGFSGLAILMKPFAVYPLFLMALFLVISMVTEDRNWWANALRLLRQPSLWAFAVTAALLPGIYYLGLGNRNAEFASFWIVAMGGMLKDPKFYIHWLSLISSIVDKMVVFASLLGIFLFPRRGRALAAGLWAGYFLIGITFPYQIYTHDYYSLILVPMVAFTLTPYADMIMAKLAGQPRLWALGFATVLVVVFSYYTFVSSQQLFANNYASEAISWQKMGQELPAEGKIIGLTHDYGNRLKYFGWHTVNRMWPSQADLSLSSTAGDDKLADFDAYFSDQTAGMDYFLVTLFGDFEAQPALKTLLTNHYPVVQQGDGYILFDLHSPIP